jgi:hypothetical protein
VLEDNRIPIVITTYPLLRRDCVALSAQVPCVPCMPSTSSIIFHTNCSSSPSVCMLSFPWCDLAVQFPHALIAYLGMHTIELYPGNPSYPVSSTSNQLPLACLQQSTTNAHFFQLPSISKCMCAFAWSDLVMRRAGRRPHHPKCCVSCGESMQAACSSFPSCTYWHSHSKSCTRCVVHIRLPHARLPRRPIALSAPVQYCSCCCCLLCVLLLNTRIFMRLALYLRLVLFYSRAENGVFVLCVCL